MDILNPRAKLLWHGNRVKEWLLTGKTSPVLAEIAPTGYCNAKCPWCFFKDKLSDAKADKDILKNVLRDMSENAVKAVNWSGGGEPTLHPSFAEFVLCGARLGLKQGLFTNAYEVIPEQQAFDWIRISLTDKGFDMIKRPQVPFGICLNQMPWHTKTILKKICRQAKAFGAAYFQARPALLGGYREQPRLEIPFYLKCQEDSRFKVYLTEYKYAQSRRPKEYKYCYGFNFCVSVNWRCELVTCLYFVSDPRFVIGDLKEETFREVRQRMSFVKTVGECQNCCKNHEINILLDEALHVKNPEFL